MLKIAGIVCMLAFCSMCGAMVAAGLRRRRLALGKAQLFLHLLGERLCYTLSPVDELFAALAEEPLLRPLDFIPQCSSLMAEGVPFPEAFRESVEKSRCALDGRDRALLCEICGIVGALQAERQLEGLALVKANIAEQERAAGEDIERRAKLYTSLGVLSGVAVAIVLL